jgi:tetratricopeptide (TPR) repeat protein
MNTFLAAIFLAQVGPGASAAPNPVTQLPPEVLQRQDMERRRAIQRLPAEAAPRSGQAAGCVDSVSADPAGAVMAVQSALNEARGAERVRAGMCLGIAFANLGQWDKAQQAFLTARDDAGAAEHGTRARLADMAANAALAQGQPTRALAILQPAQASAKAAEDPELGATVAVDRARALVALGQQEDAVAALADARALAPGNPQAWLLSATLSRRRERLDDAQAQIEEAARLAPSDPDVALEAGVIAVLSDREDAARKSWNSVLALAPGSAQAETAQDYLDQIAPEGANP